MSLPRTTRYRYVLSGIVLVSAGLFSSGCTSITVTDEEQLILRKTAAVYEAEVSAKSGYRLPSDEHKNKGRYIEITIAEPKSVTAGPQTELAYLASGCAYAICKARFRTGVAPYDFVRVIITTNGKKELFEYPDSTIELYRKQYVRIGKLLVAIRKQGFHKEYFNESYTDSVQAYRVFKFLNASNPDSMQVIGFKEGRIDSSKALGIEYLLVGADRCLTIITDLDSTKAPFIGFNLMK